jgi:1-acyl-sn-glycerol-3-phosphate acyltransferase
VETGEIKLKMVSTPALIGTEIPWTYRALRGIIDLLLRILTRREYAGLEYLDLEPPCIVALNHISVFDTPLLFTIIRYRATAFAADKYRSNPLYGPLLKMMEAIFVRRGEVDRQALREALAWLERGGVLGVAPEGTRARGPYALQEAKTGVAYLAARADVPILPVGVAGTENLKANLPKLRRTRIQVRVGEPIHLAQTGRLRSSELRAYTDLIMARIAELLPEEYRGFYA